MIAVDTCSCGRELLDPMGFACPDCGEEGICTACVEVCCNGGALDEDALTNDDGGLVDDEGAS